jgi:hypothetical protein
MTDDTQTGLAADGPAWEPPDRAREAPDPGYGAAFRAMFHQGSTTEMLGRFAERLDYEDTPAAKLFRGLGSAIDALPGGPGTDWDAKPKPASIISAAEANERYAPMGPDGKRVSIADGEIAEPVARLLGQARADEMDNEAVISAFSAHHSGLAGFGVGSAAFMLDPVNAGRKLRFPSLVMKIIQQQRVPPHARQIAQLPGLSGPHRQGRQALAPAGDGYPAGSGPAGRGDAPHRQARPGGDCGRATRGKAQGGSQAHLPRRSPQRQEAG